MEVRPVHGKPPDPTRCPLCNSDELRTSHRFSSRWTAAWECERCDTAFVWPTPSPADLTALYQGYGGFEDSTEAPGAVGHANSRETEWLAQIEGYGNRSGAMIDLGCSGGGFLEAAKSRGWDVTGIEVDRATADRTAHRLGVPVHVGLAADVLDALGQYDLIVASHVLEHLDTPGASLGVIRRHLARQGFLFLRTPNGRSRGARFLRSRWNWFRPPLHLCYFSPATVDYIAREWDLTLLHFEVRRGDAHLFPVEILLSAGRVAMGQDRFRSLCARTSPPTASAARLVAMLDQNLPGNRWLTSNDDSEMLAIFRAPSPS